MGACFSWGQDLRKAPVVTVSNQSRDAIRRLEQKEADMEKFVWATIAKGRPYTDAEFPPE